MVRLMDIAGGTESDLAPLVQMAFDATRALAVVAERIAAFEQQYKLTSDDMRKQVLAGDMAETDEICTWLMLMNRRQRLEQRAGR